VKNVPMVGDHSMARLSGQSTPTTGKQSSLYINFVFGGLALALASANPESSRFLKVRPRLTVDMSDTGTHISVKCKLLMSGTPINHLGHVVAVKITMEA